eukprot:UN05655
METFKTKPNNVELSIDTFLLWSGQKMISKNATTGDMRVLKFYDDVIEYFKEKEKQMVDHQADPFLPLVVDRSIGNLKSQVSSLGKKVLESAEDVYPAQKIIVYVLDIFQVSKNNRARTACLEVLDRLIQDYGMPIVDKKPP